MILCKECIFSVKNIENGNLECRFNPPQLVTVPQQDNEGRMGVGIIGIFPAVQVNQWCAHGTDECYECNMFTDVVTKGIAND